MHKNSFGFKTAAALGVPAISLKVWHSGAEMMLWKWSDPIDCIIGATLIVGLAYTIYDLIHWSRHFPLRGVIRFGLIGGMVASGYLLLVTLVSVVSGEFDLFVLKYLAIAMFSTAALGALDSWLTPRAPPVEPVALVKKPEPPAQFDWIKQMEMEEAERQLTEMRKKHAEELAVAAAMDERNPYRRVRHFDPKVV